MSRVAAAVLFFAALLAMCSQSLQQRHDGRMKMCPPGGSSFTMAWSMTCSMRRRKREADPIYAKRALVIPSIRQLQSICCQVGCNVNDLLPYCAPL